MLKGFDVGGAGAVPGASVPDAIEPISDREAAEALDRAVGQVAMNLPLYGEKCQNHSSVAGVYPPCGNDQWTTGFWPGEIWLAWERSGDPEFRRAGERYVESFSDRIRLKIAVDHHDMGFLYSPSCVSAWKLTGNETARAAAILAARQLLARFQERGAFFQAWGPMGDPENYRFIIDCLMNLPLLYWASSETGEAAFADKADRHAATCLAHSFRFDHSTFHTFFMDRETGKGLRGETCQGFRADSAWARGQAWAIYGLALAYGRKPDPSALELFDGVTRYYLARLPDDLVPYWDLSFNPAAVRGQGPYGPDSSGEPRDSSSASIAACGLLEIADRLEEGATGSGGSPFADSCRETARRMLGSLSRRYATRAPGPGKGHLLHGTYSKKSPYNACTEEGVDESLAWGDYFYMEALTRLAVKWVPYW